LRRRSDAIRLTEAKTPEAKAQAEAQHASLRDGALTKPLRSGGTFRTERKFTDGPVTKSEAKQPKSGQSGDE
jgi:hypothetical protein